MGKGRRICYYQSYSEDFVRSGNQGFQLSDGYQWIVPRRRWAQVLYGLLCAVGWLYCKIALHVSIKNQAVLKDYRGCGYFLYGNHTQPIGDVFLPALVSWPQKMVVIASPANLGIPFIGRLLPYLGALPTTDTVTGVKKLREAVLHYVEQKHCVVIFPEGHVWPYCTLIRPFSPAAFYFPAVTGAPSFCLSATYQKRRLGKKPNLTLYVDGPFFPKAGFTRKEQQAQLRAEIFDCMKRRSQRSNYAYIRYERREGV